MVNTKNNSVTMINGNDYYNIEQMLNYIIPAIK